MTMPTDLTMQPKCIHCGAVHPGQCLRVKAIEYFPDGTTKRIEYHTPLPVEWSAFKSGLNVS